jgi:SAM-dependent methyltransferase
VSAIDWYDANAEAFASRTFGPGMEHDHARFLAHVPAGGAVLDAGCGAGRDALAFLRAGREVTAFDGSAALARIASANTGLEVGCLTFAEMDWEQAFDGVWACATLLHLPLADLPATFARIARALKPGGVFYASFKEGTGERLANGRPFTDVTTAGLEDLMTGAGLELLDCWRSADGRTDHAGEIWVAAVGRRPSAASEA